MGAEIGSKVFDGTVNSVIITKDSDGSEILKRDVSFRMNLDNAFFQNKIIAKQGNQVLKDAASFIRYFRGISISVLENEGYLFSMAPNDADITLYYKNDVKATDGTVTRTKQQTSLNIGMSNVHLSQVAYTRAGTSYATAMSNAINVTQLKNKNLQITNPADKLYLQGMGGSSIGIRIPVSTIKALRDDYKNNKIAIASAKIRLYNDESDWNNKYRKPASMLVKERDSVSRFLPDMAALANTGYSLIKTNNLATADAYYEIGITVSLKKIIEDDTYYDFNKYDGKDFIVNLGSYLSNPSTGTLLGQNYNTRAYNPFRLVLTGTDTSKIGLEIPTTSRNVQLRLIYTKK